jgi:hypothetical protein
MKHTTLLRTRRVPRGVRSLPIAGAVLFALAGTIGLSSCSGGGGSAGSANTPGQILVDPDTGEKFVVDANHSGQANKINLVQSFWGRMVDIYDYDVLTGIKTLQFTDYVIGDNVQSNGTDFDLDRSAVTEKEILTILHRADSPAFAAAFSQVDLNVQPLLPNGPNEPPGTTYTAVPRNCALVLQLDDLLDHATIAGNKNIFVATGYPPSQPFEARIIPDRTHGDLFDADGDGTAEFHTTRVTIDFTVSQIEAQNSNPPLPVNSLGLPEAQVTNQANVLVRIPTAINTSIGQFQILANTSGSGLSYGANAPHNPSSPTFDVWRAFRSSSGSVSPPDPNNGFLVDHIPPRIIGSQGVNVTLVAPDPNAAGDFLVDYTFAIATCATTPQIGDVLQLPGAYAVVTVTGTPPINGSLTDVKMSLLVGTAGTFLPGQGKFLTPYDPNAFGLPDCFVRINPLPTLPPSAGVFLQPSITVRYSEPMDPASVSAFDSFTITRTSGGTPLTQNIVGTVTPSLDLREFTFFPTLPLTHQSGATESYRVTVLGGTAGTIDLAGNALQDTFGSFLFQVEPGQATVTSDGLAFKYSSQDEDGNLAPEIRGPFLYDLAKGRIKARPVTRISAVADASQPVVGNMVPFPSPIQTPLSNFGSKMMTVWRYHDLGFGLTDDQSMNLDVEGLWWAPFSGTQIDNFDQFQMQLTTSLYLPDEVISTATNLPIYPLSGVVKTFALNQLDAQNDPLKVVHPKAKGYTVQPLDAKTSNTGTLLMPWPMNRGIPQSQWIRYTWRNTSVIAVGGPNGGGVDTAILKQISPPGQTVYGANKVPTLGLPLLMEFRCYPDDSAFGLNGFKINIAVNSSSRPAFRAFSTGGVLNTGVVKKVDPDNEPVATGGINPANGQPTGIGTEIDPSFYVGAADFVVRITRAHSIFFDTLGFNNQYSLPVLEPLTSVLPTNTSLDVAFRGSTNVSTGNGTPPASKDATKYDWYGDPFPNNGVTVQFLNNDNTWKTNPASCNTARWIQYRVSLISNPDTGLTPYLSALGLAYIK